MPCAGAVKAPTRDIQLMARDANHDALSQLSGLLAGGNGLRTTAFSTVLLPCLVPDALSLDILQQRFERFRVPSFVIPGRVVDSQFSQIVGCFSVSSNRIDRSGSIWGFLD